MADTSLLGYDPSQQGTPSNGSALQAMGPWLGALAGMAPYMGYSRMPQSKWQALAGAAGGMLQGEQVQQQQKLLGQQVLGAGLSNVNQLLNINIFRRAMGLPPLTPKDIQDGNIGAGLPSGGASLGLSTGAGQSETTGDNAPDVPDESGSTVSPASTSVAPNRSITAKALRQPPTATSSAGLLTGGSAVGSEPGTTSMLGVPQGNSFMGVRLPQGMTPMAYLMLSRLNPQAAGRVIGNQYPGPTDFTRAYQDYMNAPPQLKSLAQQRLITAAGNRYQLMRNGWAYDRVNNSWMHMPTLGEGVTGTINPATGAMAAHVIPGAPEAAETMSRAQASGPAAFRPMTTYDQFGNEIIRPSTALGGGVPGTPPVVSSRSPLTAPPIASAMLAAATGQGNRASVSPEGNTTSPPGPNAMPPVPAVKPPVPVAPVAPIANATGVPPAVQTPTPLPPVGKATLADVIPPGQMPPMRPAAPRGTFLGAPNPGTEDIQKEDAERLSSYNRQAAEGQKIYQDLQQLDGVLKRGLNTNKLAPLWTDLTNIAQGMGLKNVIPQHYDPNDSGVFSKVATDMVFASLKQLPGQPRVAEIEGLQRANPQLTLTPAANMDILTSILSNQRWMDVRSKLATEYMTRYPGAPLGYFDAQFNQNFPLVDVTQKAFDAARAAGFTMPGDVGTPSNPKKGFSVSSLPAQAQAQAAAIKQNYQKGMYGDPKSAAAQAKAQAQLRALGFPD